MIILPSDVLSNQIHAAALVVTRAFCFISYEPCGILCLFYNDNIQKGKNCFVVSKVAILDAILNMKILQHAKIYKPQQSYNFLSRLDQNANKHSNKHSLSDQCIDSIVGKPYLVDILDAILNF